MKAKPYFRQLLILIATMSVILFNGDEVFSQGKGVIQKPRVAIKTPVIGESINKHLQKYLNIQVILGEMEASLKATRKFEVLTRQKASLDAIREEQKFAKSSLAKGNAAKEGLLENANYLIMPAVQSFVFDRSYKPVPNISNKYVCSDSGMIEVSAQVLDTESAQIKATFYLKGSFKKDKVVNTKKGSPSRIHFSQMAKNVAAQMADQLVDTVFPMLVINAEGNTVWINRGKDGGLKKGEILNVYKPGKDLVDPYTGEKLGSAEKLIGKIKVVRVNPKFTIAQSVNKETMNSIGVGFIIRKP